jgi:3-hydroxyacyl-CoA dehydrogenase
VARGCLGVKSGRGWYEYTPAQITALRAELSEELIARAKHDRDDQEAGHAN